jgi:adenylate cyclase
MERKLTAILCADVHGYSRLMGDDEEATFRTLASHRRMIGSLIEQHHGRFVNSAGDSMLAQFASVVNAVQCGIEIQTALKVENANLTSARQMQFRIGINLGDVIVDGEQIYGEGVNVAARLESLAEPGGICVSGKVHEETRGKLSLNYSDLGVQKVKNIAEPVRVWRVLLNGAGPTRRDMRQFARSYWRGGVLSLAGLAIIVATVLLVQQVSFKPPGSSAAIPTPPRPSLALPDKPSIAVLPFTNMSEDREQEYFSDGITDDLITDLSRLPGLFVIARASSFTYKGKPAKLQDVGAELGVKYILAGSVRKAAERVRITVQLADAATGTELWAERFDRPLRDVFALQDEIVRRIVTTLDLQLALSQQGIVIPRTTENLEAYDDVLRGMEHLLGYRKNGYAKAREMFEKAIELDPRYAVAYAFLGGNYYTGWALGLNPDPAGLEQGMHITQQAIALNDSLSLAHSVLAIFYIHNQQNAHLYEHNPLNDQALTEAQRSIALDPNSALGYSTLAETLNMEGKHADALPLIEKAMRLDPRNSAQYMYTQAYAYSGLERWKEASSSLKIYLFRYPDQIWAHHWLAINYFNLRDHDGAREETAQVERLAALNPSAVGYSALSIALNVQGKAAEAVAAAEKGKAFDPSKRRNLAFDDVGVCTVGTMGRSACSFEAICCSLS